MKRKRKPEVWTGMPEAQAVCIPDYKLAEMGLRYEAALAGVWFPFRLVEHLAAALGYDLVKKSPTPREAAKT